MIRTQHAVNQVPEPVCFADNNSRIFPEFGLFQFAFEQLGGAAQPSRRILNFVRHTAHQVTRRDAVAQVEFPPARYADAGQPG